VICIFIFAQTVQLGLDNFRHYLIHAHKCQAATNAGGRAASKVARTSKSAVSRVSKPAACATAARPADCKVGDTAGLETCATCRRWTAADNPRKNELFRWQTLSSATADADVNMTLTDPLSGNPPTRYYRAGLP
jgi:hypothetical protein